MLRPFLSYYGGKWRAAPSYPEPRYATIVEPFAGGAGYSLRYPDRDVILVERNPKVAAIWRYLIGADPDRIRSLPDIGPEGVDAHDLRDAERWLIGFWVGAACKRPRKRPTSWAARSRGTPSFWGPECRERIASQVSEIRHWRVIEGDFSESPEIEATWFIDPPYEKKGYAYPCKMSHSDFVRLGAFARSRAGQVIVCEQEGAGWMPFRPHKRVQTVSPHGSKWSNEVVWLSDEQHREIHGAGSDD